MPASSARATVRRWSSRSPLTSRPPIAPQPNPRTETRGPFRPSVRYSIAPPDSLVRRPRLGNTLTSGPSPCARERGARISSHLLHGRERELAVRAPPVRTSLSAIVPGLTLSFPAHGQVAAVIWGSRWASAAPTTWLPRRL